MGSEDLFVKRARLIVEMIIFMDIDRRFIDACRNDAECNRKLNEIARTVGENDWWEEMDKESGEKW
jgi:hypothetical protein